ncbi:hypothetical protein QR680_017776 [Steinernema hermaphroditum]|uniref:Uncharacterized protein n=1 Tax=Steinernema hermaphroditum TaxID=289476 RepID=A0AA39LPM2_9BILA|nr:hypothetical protein QR680_017776 [Steinernema hermaphroditum]
MAFRVTSDSLSSFFVDDDDDADGNNFFCTLPTPETVENLLTKNESYDLSHDLPMEPTVDNGFNYGARPQSPVQFGDVSSSADQESATGSHHESFVFAVDERGRIVSVRDAADRRLEELYHNRSVLDVVHVHDRPKMCEALRVSDGIPFACHLHLPSGEFAEYKVAAVPSSQECGGRPSDLLFPERAQRRVLGSPECPIRASPGRVPSTSPAPDDSPSGLLHNPIDILQTLKRKIPAEEIDENWILHLDDDSTRKKSASSQTQKRGCVVCVARKSSSDECCGDCRALEAAPDIVFTLDTKHHIVKFEIKAPILEISEDGMVGKSVDQLCWKNDKAVLDTLLDSTAQCSAAQLILCIGEWTLTTQATSKRSRVPNETVTLECSIVRSRKQSVPKSAPIDSDPREAPRWPRPSAEYSTPSSSSSAVAEPSDGRLQSPSTMNATARPDDAAKFFGTPQSAPPLTGSSSQFEVFHYPSSGPPPSAFLPPPSMSSQLLSESPPQVEINPKTGKPKRPRKPRAPRATTTRKKSAPQPSTVVPDDIAMPPPYSMPRQLPTMKAPWETGLTYPTGQARDTMLKTLLQAAPSSGVSTMEAPPASRTMKSPVPRDATSSVASSALWLQKTSTPTMLPPPGAPSSTTNSSMLARLLEPPSTPPSLGASQTAAEEAVEPSTPTKTRRQVPKEPRKRAPRSSKAEAKRTNPPAPLPTAPLQSPMFQNPPQMSPFLPPQNSTRFGHPDNNCAFSASTSGLFDPQPTMQMHQMYQNPPQMAAPNMMATSSNGVQWSGISPPPDYGLCHPQQPQNQMMFEPQPHHQQQHLGAPMGGGVTAPPALQVVPEQGKGGANKKRKTPNGMIDRPPKQPYMNPPMGFQASPMYPQANSVPSSHYSSQPSTPMPNHLSPYNCYDGQNNANGWSNGSQRPPSRSELIRMELQRTVQARKASASPNSMPPAMMSPQDLGAPRFTAPSTMSPVMLSPQSMLQPTPQSLQQQPTPPATFGVSQDFSGYGPLVEDPVHAGVFPTDQQLCNSSSISNLSTVEYFDFNLGNGGFDMDNETTQRLVQKLLS